MTYISEARLALIGLGIFQINLLMRTIEVAGKHDRL